MMPSTDGHSQAPQIEQVHDGAGGVPGPEYPAMGNHECTGATASNCGTGNTDGVTKNMTAFISTMLGPIDMTAPVLHESFTASDGSWTAKFVFVACNAWDSTQATWLTSSWPGDDVHVRRAPRGERSDMSSHRARTSQTIIDANALTLLIVGHTHEYDHESYDKEIIVGIGGAPLTSGTNYGYVIVVRNTAGTLTVTAYDYKSHAAIDTFRIQANGDAA